MVSEVRFTKLHPIGCRLAAGLLLLLSFAAGAGAQSISFPDLGEAVPGADGITYLDLVRQVVPDIAATENGYEGRRLIEIRGIDGSDTENTPPETVSLFAAAVLPIQSDGKDRLLMLLDLGQAEDSTAGYAVLALYGLAGTPTLLDAAQIGYDRNTYFLDPGFLSLGEGKNLVLTMSTHSNSNQAYVTTLLTLLRNDRLQFVDTVFTFNDNDCSYDRQQVPAFRAGDRDARAYPDIVATVTETTRPSGADCGEETPPPEGTRTITVTYRWDEEASRFVPDSDAFGKLAAEDAERF
jgi:hypothetical protein